MKTWTVAAALLFVGSFGFAQTAQTAPAVPATPSAPTARKPCEDLKAEIAKKLDAKGVTSYSLEAVDKGKEGEGKIVGSCDGGTKSIVYTRTEAGAAPAKPADTKKPQ
jgi:uncharacterized protein DUF1161